MNEQPASAEQVGAFIERVYKEKDALPPEGAKMLQAIAQGSQMRLGEGWFGPAQTRFDYAWLCRICKVDNGDNGITRAQFPGSDALFAVLDRDRDGAIVATDLDWSPSNPFVSQGYMLNRIFRKLDTKGDGLLTREEWIAVFNKAAQGKDALTAEEFAGAMMTGVAGPFFPGDRPNTTQLIRALFAGEIGSMLEGPKVGQQAPLFRLKRARTEGSVDLASLIGDKPVVLVFGNFTCGPFRAFYPAVDRLYEKYRDRAHFLMVYVREAHPTDGWMMESNSKAGVEVAQPKSFDQRMSVANQFCTKLNPNIPLVVDELSDPVGHAYSGMPARLYVVDREGKVAFKSGRGPFGFSPPELEQALAMSLLETPAPAPAPAPAPVPANKQSSLQPLDEAETWARLPRTLERSEGQLPHWARILAKQLPRTTAALLRLDYVHRAESPLEPKLRAKLRLVIALANRCDYARDVAIADLLRSGGARTEVDAVLAGPEQWSGDDRLALLFARQHSLDAATLADEHFEQLRKRYGDKQVAAIVLLGAYGNFQDRLLLGLGVKAEGPDPLRPLRVVFTPDAFATLPVLPAHQVVPDLIVDGKDVVADDGDWESISFDELQARLQIQKERRQRLPTPTWEEVANGLPAGFAAKPTRIVWNLVCMGYAPELALPWMTATRTMWVEAPQDRTLEESLFWVQTRAIECNYCMGHCEMLLELAGHSPQGIEARLRRLASNDWSAFPEREQRAFAYARKLTKTPWDLTAGDYQSLEADYGPRDAMAIFFWLCRGLYMTRISDGFALQLERDNVFVDFAKPSPVKP